MNISLLSLLQIALSLAGLVCCYLFYLQTHGKNKAHGSVHPVCNDGSCSMLIESRYYHLFYFPNWYFGTVFYLFTLIVAFFTNTILIDLAILGSVASFITSLYLIWALVYRLKTVCKICYSAHTVNLLLLIVLILRLSLR